MKTGDMSRPADTRMGGFEDVGVVGVCDWVGQIARLRTSWECSRLEQLWIHRRCPVEDDKSDRVSAPDTFTDKNSVTFWSTPDVYITLFGPMVRQRTSAP